MKYPFKFLEIFFILCIYLPLWKVLWKTYGESCDNFNSLHGHSASVLDVAWLRDGAHLVSASADKTVNNYKTGEKEGGKGGRESS